MIEKRTSAGYSRGEAEPKSNTKENFFKRLLLRWTGI
jgi:hypothetical protein